MTHLNAIFLMAVCAFFIWNEFFAEPAAAQATEEALSVDVDRGKILFGQCSPCHVASAGAESTIGPNLWNIVDRRIASEALFYYSDSLRQVGGDWTFERLNTYLEDPKSLAPEGRMPFPGIASAKQRAQLIAYLRTLSLDPVDVVPSVDMDLTHSSAQSESSDNSEDKANSWQGLPPGPGREDVFYRCNACHSLMIVKQQGLSRADWSESLDWMVEEQGMSPIEDEAIRGRILDYLAAHFGVD